MTVNKTLSLSKWLVEHFYSDGTHTVRPTDVDIVTDMFIVCDVMIKLKLSSSGLNLSFLGVLNDLPSKQKRISTKANVYSY